MKPSPARAAAAAFLATALLLTSACNESGTEPPPVPTWLELPASELVLGVGETVSVSATLLDQEGRPFPQRPAGETLSWSVGDVETASIAGGDAWNEARITGLDHGVTLLTASIAGLTATAPITVLPLDGVDGSVAAPAAAADVHEYHHAARRDRPRR